MAHITVDRGTWDFEGPNRIKLEKALGGPHHLKPRLRVQIGDHPENRVNLDCSWREAVTFWSFLFVVAERKNVKGRTFRHYLAEDLWAAYQRMIDDGVKEAALVLPRDPDKYLKQGVVFQGLAQMVINQARRQAPRKDWDSD